MLDKLNIEFDEKYVYAILGPNGSGKTTLMKSILGMVIPTTGDIFLQGKSIKQHDQYRNDISYLPQTPNFPTNLSVLELIHMMRDLKSRQAKTEQLIDLFGLKPFLNKKLIYLSGGTKQKVNILLAFMFDSPIFILDEPSVGLDPLALTHLKELILEKKETNNIVLITTHILSFVEELADEIIFLLEGKVYYRGTISNLQKQTGEAKLEKAIAVIYQNHVFQSS